MRVRRGALPAEFLMTGQPVIYEGSDTPADYDPKSRRVLRSGHPGRIFDPSPQHIRVNWFGFENEPVSFATGYTRNDSRTSVPGLMLSNEAEYAELTRAMIYMLVDREPGYDDLTIGTLVRATTEWVFADWLPDEITSHDLSAMAIQTGHSQYSLQIESGQVNALVSNPPDWFHEGNLSVSGCLEWDRHTRDVHPSLAQETHGRVVSTGVLIRVREDGGFRYSETTQSRPALGSDPEGIAFDCVGLAPLRHT